MASFTRWCIQQLTLKFEMKFMMEKRKKKKIGSGPDIVAVLPKPTADPDATFLSTYLLLSYRHVVPIKDLTS